MGAIGDKICAVGHAGVCLEVVAGVCTMGFSSLVEAQAYHDAIVNDCGGVVQSGPTERQVYWEIVVDTDQ